MLPLEHGSDAVIGHADVRRGEDRARDGAGQDLALGADQEAQRQVTFGNSHDRHPVGLAPLMAHTALAGGESDERQGAVAHGTAG